MPKLYFNENEVNTFKNSIQENIYNVKHLHPQHREPEPKSQVNCLFITINVWPDFDLLPSCAYDTSEAMTNMSTIHLNVWMNWIHSNIYN